ncbi:MAG: NAD-dependent epimerase/dehydratase family protein [Bacteroidota bacterium]
MRPRAVVAGGGGFLGYHFVKHLIAKDFDVVIIDNYATGTHRNVQD